MGTLDTRTRLSDAAAAQAGSCLSCASRLVGLCAPLDARILTEVSQASSRSPVAARDSLFLQGDPATHVFILVDGSARLTRLLPDGRRAAIGFRFAGDLIGYTSNDEYPFGAEALSASQVCRLERRRLDDLFRRHPLIERRFLDLCTRELAATQDHVMVLGRYTAEERVAAFLMSLAEAQARRGHAGPTLELPATRADLGELLGLTLETVSRMFSSFRKRGWIRLHGQSSVELTNRRALGALARGEVSELDV